MGLKIRNYPFMKDVTDKELAHFDDGLFTTFLRDWYFASGDFHQQKTRVDEMSFSKVSSVSLVEVVEGRSVMHFVQEDIITSNTYFEL